MRGLWEDVRQAGRVLRKSPGFTAVVVLVLGVGIGANVAVFAVINAALLRALPYPRAERLVMGETTFDGRVNPMGSYQDYVDYRETATTFESLSAIRGFPRSHTVTGGEQAERVPGIVISFDLFRTLSVDPQLGRHFNREESTGGSGDVAIISHSYWQRRFGGSPTVIGRTVMVDGHPHTVIGVMPRGFHFLFDVDIWRPLRPDSDFTRARRFHNWLMIGRLRDGTSLEAAQGQVDAISGRLREAYPDSNSGKALRLTELQTAMSADYQNTLFILMATVALVLLIACGNVAGLMLARGSTRRAELSVRAALGASAGRLVRFVLAESVLLAVTAGALGVVLALSLQRLILAVVPVDRVGIESAEVSATMLTFALGLSFLTGLAFGTVPALRTSRSDLAHDLRSGTRTTDATGARFRGGLVVGQVALSVILLVVSGLLIRSLARLTSVDPGFHTEHLLTAEIHLPDTEYGEAGRRVDFFASLQERTRALPGVTGVGLINQLPIRDPGNNIYVHAADRPPQDPGDQRIAFYRVVMPGYFEAMGIPRLAGRVIEPSDREGAPLVVVINETMARELFSGEDPRGRRVVIDLGEPTVAEVVGVVGDVRMEGLGVEARSAMYLSYYQRPQSVMRIALRTSGPAEALAAPLRAAVWSHDRDIPVSQLMTMEEVLSASISGFSATARALGIFAAIALLLAAVGLYGVLAFYVSERAHEIGIRLALGADAAGVARLVAGRGLTLVVIGLVLGMIGALGATRLIANSLYAVGTADPVTYLGVGAFLALVAGLACGPSIWQAARVDPMIALRAE